MDDLAHAERARDHLDATAELPVSPRASPWLGEAAAVAGQAADPSLDAATRRERLTHLARLLDDAGDPDSAAAADHVAAAREAVAAALDQPEGTA
jgi:hypothetical protein